MVVWVRKKQESRGSVGEEWVELVVRTVPARLKKGSPDSRPRVSLQKAYTVIYCA